MMHMSQVQGEGVMASQSNQNAILSMPGRIMRWRTKHLSCTAGARLAHDTCDEVTAKNPTRPRVVVGAIGPTNRTPSIFPSAEDPSAMIVTFDELEEKYFEEVVGFVYGGADILMFEHMICH